MRITRKLEFDSGHRVLGHEGKCRHLHGHRYVAEVTVEADSLDDIGRVIDFSVVKQRVGEWVDEFWDHNLLLNKHDPLCEVTLLTIDDRQPFLMDGNPTAENMAKSLFEVARALLPTEIRVVHVRIYETPNCWADYGD